MQTDVTLIDDVQSTTQLSDATVQHQQPRPQVNYTWMDFHG